MLQYPNSSANNQFRVINNYLFFTIPHSAEGGANDLPHGLRMTVWRMKSIARSAEGGGANDTYRTVSVSDGPITLMSFRRIGLLLVECTPTGVFFCNEKNALSNRSFSYDVALQAL